jgi:hypothetical protein
MKTMSKRKRAALPASIKLAGVKFYIAPGASADSPEEDKMLRGHEAEAARHGAEFYNYGKALAQNSICSKTSIGILTSCIDPATMTVSHHWKWYD